MPSPWCATAPAARTFEPQRDALLARAELVEVALDRLALRVRAEGVAGRRRGQRRSCASAAERACCEVQAVEDGSPPAAAPPLPAAGGLASVASQRAARRSHLAAHRDGDGAVVGI